MAIEEYRFEVRLNWDRMQYYAVINSAIIAAAAGLVKETSSAGALALCSTLFFAGFIMSAIGVTAIHKGREYYQETIFKKTVFEEMLGLNKAYHPLNNPRATLAIGTTSGMKDANKILAGKPQTPFMKRLFRNRVISHFIWFLILLALIDLAGMAYTGGAAFKAFESERAKSDAKQASPPNTAKRSLPAKAPTRPNSAEIEAPEAQQNAKPDLPNKGKD